MTSRIDLTQLRAFHKLVQAGSFTLAGLKLNLSQSAISHAISKLEDSIGCQLLDRRTRTLRLTEEGQLLFSTCNNVFDSIDRVSEDLIKYRQRKRIRLGANIEFGNTILMNYIKPFMLKYPQISLDFHFALDPLTPLLKGGLDLVLDCHNRSLPELDRSVLWKEKFVACAAKSYMAGHPLDKPDDLATCALISLDKEGTWWDAFFEALPEGQRPMIHTIIPINQVRGMITLAVNGYGVIWVPRYAVLPELESERLIQILPQVDPPDECMYLYQPKAKSGQADTQVLIEYLKSFTPDEFKV